MLYGNSAMRGAGSHGCPSPTSTDRVRPLGLVGGTRSRETLLKVRWTWGSVSRSQQNPGAPLDTVGGPGGRDEPCARPRRDRGPLVQGTACRMDGRPGALWALGQGAGPQAPERGLCCYPVAGGSPSALGHEDSLPKSSDHFRGPCARQRVAFRVFLLGKHVGTRGLSPVPVCLPHPDMSPPRAPPRLPVCCCLSPPEAFDNFPLSPGSSPSSVTQLGRPCVTEPSCVPPHLVSWRGGWAGLKGSP